MSDAPIKPMGGSCLGRVLGALAGIVIGGFVGPLIATSENSLRRNPDPLAKEVSGLFDGCFGFFGMLVGASAGGIIGGGGGAVFGAGVASRQHALPHEAPELTVTTNQVLESSEAEVARLKERIAELEDQQKNADPTNK